ncbi:MAG: hypothetical protein AAF393_17370 [Pseudomonadota bacterium]
MIRQMIRTMSENPAALLEDILGMSAIVVMLLVSLHVPVAF